VPAEGQRRRPINPLAFRADEPGMERLPAQLLASLSSGVVAIDERGEVVLVNAAAARILAIDPAAARAARGRASEQLLGAEPALLGLLRGVLAGQPAVSRAELALGSRSSDPDAVATIGLTLSPIRDGRGRLRGAAALFRDLAPIEREVERERQRDRLAALGQTVAGLAHEIRNPLAGMEVIGGLLRRRLADRPEESSLVADLLGQLRRVAATVSECLDFVRPPALAAAALELAPLLEEALALARLRAPFEGEVQRDYAAGLPRVSADPHKLRVVLTDVIANALEAMEGAGVLTLALALRPAAPARSVVIGISDTGPGVAEELREKIFYPFFTTRERGSGVGLANAQKVIAAHGGQLELVSKPGGGAHFEIRLPADGPPR